MIYQFPQFVFLVKLYFIATYCYNYFLYIVIYLYNYLFVYLLCIYMCTVMSPRDNYQLLKL